MSDCQSVIEAFSRSLSSHASYPHNLLDSHDFPHVLDSYNSHLRRGDKVVFRSDKETLVLSDLVECEDGTFTYSDVDVRGTEKLDQLLAVDNQDPVRRFCFLQSTSSRGPLMCSGDQLTKILSRHQVMPRFLDFVFTFKQRREPHGCTSFRCEDSLNPPEQEASIEPLRKSGVRLQHCFNILGIEPDNSNPGSWLQRQVAAYHSFDVLNGSAFWIVMKGDDTIQKRMQITAAHFLKPRSRQPNTIYESFQQTLREHSLLLQWGAENWEPRTITVEEKYQRYTAITRYPHLQDLADDVPKHVQRRRTTMDSRYTGEKKPKKTLLGAISQRVRQMTCSADGAGSPTSPTLPRGNTGLSTHSHRELAPLKDSKLKLDELASFDGLQNITSIMLELHTALAIIDQNKRAFADVKARYAELRDSAFFMMHHDESQLQQCQGAIDSFVSYVRCLEGDLEGFEGRLRSLLHKAQEAGNMYNNIFQLRNMRTAEFFASTAQDSTDSMQIWTEQMVQKTMSMHLITIFTLIFLPGTFVATIFSSGIVIFGTEGGGGFGPNMGDWKVRIAGLKLFFAICLPLLTITLGVWLRAYVSARMKSANGRLRKRSDSLELEKGDVLV